jgi:spore germination protein
MFKRYFLVCICFVMVFAFTSPSLVAAETTTSTGGYVIYEVKPGDSLWKIAKLYGKSITQLKDINGLKTTDLIPGQALIIPGSKYICLPGESLWEIAQRHNISVSRLAKANGLKSDSRLKPKQRLTIPSVERYTVDSLGYIVPKSKESDQWLVKKYKPLVSHMGVFESHPDYSANLSPLAAEASSWACRVQNIRPVLVITNLTEKGFDHNLAGKVLGNKELRQKLINNIYWMAKKYQFKGVNIDFEGLKVQERNMFNQFIMELSQKILRRG